MKERIYLANLEAVNPEHTIIDQILELPPEAYGEISVDCAWAVVRLNGHQLKVALMGSCSSIQLLEGATYVELMYSPHRNVEMRARIRETSTLRKNKLREENEASRKLRMATVLGLIKEDDDVAL